MKALTVKQPWASLIVWGHKDVESRSWPTSYRGKIYIHAAASMKKKSRYEWDLMTKAQQDVLAGYQRTLVFWKHLPLSRIIGEVEIVDCVKDSDSIWAQEGQWHWVLANAKEYEKPIPAKGALSFWNPMKYLVSQVC